MKKPPIPSNEVERLKELQSLRLLEDMPDEDLDLITKLASDICGTKVSLVTLIDSKTQVFKSTHGIELEKTSRDVAFCAHAINTPDKMLIVNDATEDERFKGNPLVTKDPKIAFYAGMPLSTKEGLALGTLCVIDSKPKVLSASQIEALKALSKLVERLFESRRNSNEYDKALEQLQLQKSQTEEMAYSIAHDLKNPLHNIQGFLELLQHENNTILSEASNQYIDHARESILKMTGLINEVLTYTKLASISENEEIVEVESIIQNILELNLPIIKSEGINIEYQNLPTIKTSKILFSVVLRNLIENAIKYKSAERPLKIKIEIQDKKDEWVVSVSDNGKGIQKQNLERIFKPFYKEKQEHTSSIGMGLATCKKMVQTLGGKLNVESDYNKGSTFRFSISK